MGCLVFIVYVAASVALIFLPWPAKVGVGIVAFAAVYATVHRGGRVTATGVRGAAARVAITIAFWALLFAPSYVIFKVRGG